MGLSYVSSQVMTDASFLVASLSSWLLDGILVPLAFAFCEWELRTSFPLLAEVKRAT